MPLTRIDENELLGPLHQGPLEDGAWFVFLARLRRRAGADYAGLLFGHMDGRTDAARELFVAAPDSRALRDGLQLSYHRQDPGPHRRLRPDRIYGAPDFPDPTDPAHDGYREAIFDHGDFQDQRLLRIGGPGGPALWLMIARREELMGAAESALLSALVPHLHIALGTTIELDRTRRRAALAEAAAGRLGLGWVTFDDKGRALDTGGHRLPDSHRDGLAGAIVGLGDRESSRAVRLGEEPRLDILVQPLAGAGAGDPVAVAWLRAGDVCGADPVDVLVALHGLSRNEARLAWALCEGSSIEEAAGQLGLTRETARNYSKRAYAKVGARGQADLVRLILTGIAPLA